jgi:hypothetical protein
VSRKLFQPGNNGHGGGRPPGVRNTLNKRLLEDLSENWHRNGKAALEIMFREKPSEYVRACLSILPREFTFESVTNELDDEQLDLILEGLRQRILETRKPEPVLIENGSSDARH